MRGKWIRTLVEGQRNIAEWPFHWIPHKIRKPLPLCSVNTSALVQVSMVILYKYFFLVLIYLVCVYSKLLSFSFSAEVSTV